jgi:hypothetical protein
MRELMTLFLPIAGFLSLLAYLLLIHPQSLMELGRWLQQFF